MGQVQGESKSGIAVTSLGPWTFSPTASAAALVVRGFLTAGAISSIVDNLGQTWTQRIGATEALKHWDCLGSTAGVTSITVNFSGSCDAILFASERDDIDLVDQLAYTEVGTTTAPSSGNTPATTNTDTVALGTFATFSSDNAHFTPTNGYSNSTGTGLTNGNRGTGAGTSAYNSEKVISGTGVQAATATCDSSYVYAGVVVYRKKAIAPPAPSLMGHGIFVNA